MLQPQILNIPLPRNILALAICLPTFNLVIDRREGHDHGEAATCIRAMRDLPSPVVCSTMDVLYRPDRGQSSESWVC